MRLDFHTTSRSEQLERRSLRLIQNRRKMFATENQMVFNQVEYMKRIAKPCRFWKVCSREIQKVTSDDEDAFLRRRKSSRVEERL